MKTQMKSNRKAAILPLAAICLLMMFIAVGLLVNVNLMTMSKTELQAASDNATRSTMMVLLKSRNNLNSPQRARFAREVGQDIFRCNDIAGVSYNIAGNRIQFGEIDNGEFVRDENQLNASATAIRLLTPDDVRVGLAFGKILGLDQYKPKTETIVNLTSYEIVIALDVSCSMAQLLSSKAYPPGMGPHRTPQPGSRFYALRDATLQFLEQLDMVAPNARVGLCSYGGGQTWDMPKYVREVSTPLQPDKSRIESGLQPAGFTYDKGQEMFARYLSYDRLGWGTSIWDGLNDAREILSKGTKDTEKFVIVVGDGCQSAIRRPSPDEIALDLSAQGIKVHVILQDGTPQGEPAMKSLAEAGEGMFMSSREPDGLHEGFQKILKYIDVGLVR